jgi:hypothetical protein
MSKSHKDTIELFTDTVNSRHIQDLDKVIDENIQKYINSKIVYQNIQEAREYYSMEHEANPLTQWNILDYQVDNLNNNTMKATISFNNHIYNTTYTFNSSGKIIQIVFDLQQQQ